MANVRIIPIDSAKQAVEDLVVLNAATLTYPKESMWVHNAEGDLTVSAIIAGRSGSWISRFNLNTVDSPPLIEWVYSAGAANEAQVVVQQEASRAQLRVSNIDIQPKPQSSYPDTHWVKNGLDIIPRSSN
jgi:hypothetical protein